MATNGSVESTETNDDASAQKLIDLLEFEIKRIEEKQKRPGWTAWALAGAIAALLWAGLSLLEAAKQFDRAVISFLVLTIIAVWDFGKVTHRLITLVGGSTGVARFRWSRDEYGKSRIAVVCNAFRSSAVLLLAWNVLDGAHPWAHRALLLFYAIGVFSAFTALLGSFFSVAVPASESLPKKAGLVGGVLALLVMFGLFGLFERLSNGSLAPTIVEWKVAGIIVALVITLQMLWSGGYELPLMQTLIDLRRQLATSEITCGAARRQFDIAIRGLGATDVLQRRVEGVLTTLRSAVGLLSDAAVQLRVLKNQFERSPDMSLIDKRALSEPLLNAVEDRLKDGEARIDAASKEIGLLRGHARVMSSMYPTSRSDIEPILSQTEAAVSDAQSAVRSHWSTIKDDLDWLLQQEVEVPASLLDKIRAS